MRLSSDIEGSNLTSPSEDDSGPNNLIVYACGDVQYTVLIKKFSYPLEGPEEFESPPP